MNPFQGKVAVVTGGGSGIGHAICKYLADRGTTTFVVDQNEDAARKTEGTIVSQGGKARAFCADVSHPEEIRDVVDAVLNESGKIDYLFNNAGISVNGEFQDISLEQWQRIVDVDFWGVVHGCRILYPIMIRQGHGHIVNTASLAGLIPGGLTTPYSACKHAVVGFSLTLRGEAKSYGVRVSALCPGYMRTNIQSTTLLATEYLASERNRSTEAVMRFPTPEQCIGQIMRGVRRNKGIIFSPNRQKVYWWANRIAPELMPNMWGIIVKRLKKNA